jgi:hypothetical protein
VCVEDLIVSVLGFGEVGDGVGVDLGVGLAECVVDAGLEVAQVHEGEV